MLAVGRESYIPTISFSLCCTYKELTHHMSDSELSSLGKKFHSQYLQENGGGDNSNEQHLKENNSHAEQRKQHSAEIGSEKMTRKA